jgi:hypothetical protein
MPASIRGWHLLVLLTFSFTLASGYWAAVEAHAAAALREVPAAADVPAAAGVGVVVRELVAREDEALLLPDVVAASY